MKMKHMLVIAAAALFTAGTAQAERDWSWNWNDRFSYDREGKDLYAGNELTLDIFGSYTKEKAKFNDTFDKNLRHGDFGGGLGVNYFFTPMVGIGGDVIAEDNGGDFVDSTSASLIFRFPITVAHLAPYIFGGGGRQFDGPGDSSRDGWNLHAGAGIELRLNSHTGIFLDGRHVFHIKDNGTDYAMLRSGLRFAF